LRPNLVLLHKIDQIIAFLRLSKPLLFNVLLTVNCLVIFEKSGYLVIINDTLPWELIYHLETIYSYISLIIAMQF